MMMIAFIDCMSNQDSGRECEVVAVTRSSTVRLPEVKSWPHHLLAV